MILLGAVAAATLARAAQQEATLDNAVIPRSFLRGMGFGDAVRSSELFAGGASAPSRAYIFVKDAGARSTRVGAVQPLPHAELAAAAPPPGERGGELSREVVLKNLFRDTTLLLTEVLMSALNFLFGDRFALPGDGPFSKMQVDAAFN